MSPVSLSVEDRRVNSSAPLEGRRSVAAPLIVHGLAKAFGGRRVLENLDLHVPAGQFLAIVGRSGCGKSTLLRLLAGLDKPDAGSIRFGQGEARPNIRMMFQEPRLLPWARVVANIEVGLGDTRASAASRELALAALRDVGLSDRADVWPSTLSGGQRQRVALARALVSKPALLALDEPLGALDALTRIEMQQLVERVFQREGFTAVLVTHDVAEAVALADRIVVLENGRIALDLPVDLSRPRAHASPEAAAIEARILSQLLGTAAA